MHRKLAAMNPIPKIIEGEVQDEIEAITGYTLGKVLGKGSFGKVCSAIHTATGCKVAVKIFDKAAIRDEYVSNADCILCKRTNVQCVNIIRRVTKDKFGTSWSNKCLLVERLHIDPSRSAP